MLPPEALTLLSKTDFIVQYTGNKTKNQDVTVITNVTILKNLYSQMRNAGSARDF